MNADDAPRTAGRFALAGILLFAGLSHLTFARDSFRAQVPRWMPGDPDLTVVLSGFVELALGTALATQARRRAQVGLIVAAFFVAVFPGNISQYLTHTDAFGLDSDAKRGVRLLFQPVLVLWALWCTGAWQSYRTRRLNA